MSNYLEYELRQRCLLYEFVLINGRRWNPQARPTGLSTHNSNQCFHNAIALCGDRDELIYVEGYIMLPRAPSAKPVIVHHAWCADQEFNVIDPTPSIGNPENCEYFGIPFATKPVEDFLYEGVGETDNILRALLCFLAENPDRLVESQYRDLPSSD